MPPKAKFTKEEIIAAALELTREKGVSAVTARELGRRLGSSSRPIFTAFQNMEEVMQELAKAAKELYNQYVSAGLSQTLAFKGVGTQYIRFSMEEPKLFQLLFMYERPVVPDISEVLSQIDDNYQDILKSIEDGYGLAPAAAQRLYQHLWVYTHGIATLCATGMCRFSEEEIDEKLNEIFVSIFKNMKAGEAK